MTRSSRPDPDEMPCQELVELVTEYLDGALSERDLRRFDEHLADCRHCTVYVDQFRTAIATAGMLPSDRITPAVRAELVAVFRRWTAEGGLSP